MDTIEYNKSRRALTAEIKKITKPFLWPSGYKSGYVGEANRKAIPIWLQFLNGKDGDVKEFKLKGGFVIQAFEGFTDYGVITEAGYGMATLEFSQLPIEDLFRLRNWAVRKFAGMKPPKRIIRS